MMWTCQISYYCFLVFNNYFILGQVPFISVLQLTKFFIATDYNSHSKFGITLLKQSIFSHLSSKQNMKKVKFFCFFWFSNNLTRTVNLMRAGALKLLWPSFIINKMLIEHYSFNVECIFFLHAEYIAIICMQQTNPRYNKSSPSLKIDKCVGMLHRLCNSRCCVVTK